MSTPPPVPGHAGWHRMQVKFGKGYEAAFDITTPGTMPQWDISTMRLGRHGGETAADHKFRRQLYQRIGAVTVAGGHAETAMKRLLLLLRGDTAEFSKADKPWTTLHEKLTDECTGEDTRRKRLKRVLDWAEENRIRDRRHDVVHAYWWNLDGCGVVRSRFYHHDNGAMITGSFEALEEDAELLFEFARRLDELLSEDWPRAMLPPGTPA